MLWLKRKQQKPTVVEAPKIDEFLQKYDRKQLAAAMASLEGNVGFEAFKAFAQQRAAFHASQCLNLAAMQGGQYQAAYASGAEAGIRELITVDLPRYIKALRGEDGVISHDRDEE
jgi:hypothetical protein